MYLRVPASSTTGKLGCWQARPLAQWRQSQAVAGRRAAKWASHTLAAV